MAEPVHARASSASYEATGNATKADSPKNIRRILVAAEFFPSRIQPWLLNSIEVAVLRGVDVEVVATRASGTTFPARVEQLGLMERTLHLPVHGKPAFMTGLKHHLPGSPYFSRAWRGTARALASRDLRAGGLRPWMRSLFHGSLVGGKPFDLVHAHYVSSAFSYLAAPVVFNAPLVVTFHGLPPAGVGALPPERNKIVFDRGELFLLNTRFAQRQLESLGCPSEKIRILPQGVRLEEYSFSTRSLPANEPVIILTVARLQPDKGHEFAIRAVAEVLRGGGNVEYRIVSDGPERRKLEALAVELGIADRVKFLGQLDDAGLNREYSSAHIFILPSVRDRIGKHEETQGEVIQEAQASGAIVISTLTGGIPECVDDGRSAFLVPDRDAPALARAIQHILDHPERWTEWQTLAREWVETHYDMRVIGDRMWALYEEAVALNAMKKSSA